MTGIGLLNEKALHAALKAWVARPGDRFEVPLDGYVIDIVRGDLLLEIQTGRFASLKKKLKTLTRTHPVRLIYPIAGEKWIVKLPQTEADTAARRKSPKRGRVEDLFRELVSFPHLLNQENFSLDVLLIREEEVRHFVGGRSRRKRGWQTTEPRLLEVTAQRHFPDAPSLLDLLPSGMEDPFTTGDLAEGLGIRRPLAQKMAYCLREMGVIDAAGKRSRSILYRRSIPG